MIMLKKVKRLFWDIEIKPADLKKSRNFIIERVAEKGGLDDYRWLVKTYGKSAILEVVKKSKNVSSKTKNFYQVIK